MKLLGICPSCQAEDSLSVEGEKRSVLCGQCNFESEDNWLAFMGAQKEKGKRFIPVEIISHKGFGAYCKLQFPPSRGIGQADIIISVLNTALIVRFGLIVSAVSFGGVEGRWNGYPIELANTDVSIGLKDEFGIVNNRGAEEILDWYEDLLGLVFEKKLVVGGADFGRGAVLKLGTGQEFELAAMRLLHLALEKKLGENFADQVFRELQALKKSASGKYLVGLFDRMTGKVSVPAPA